MEGHDHPSASCPLPQRLNACSVFPDPQLNVTPEKDKTRTNITSRNAVGSSTYTDGCIVFDVARSDNQAQNKIINKFTSNSSNNPSNLKRVKKKVWMDGPKYKQTTEIKNSICASASMTPGRNVKTNIIKGNQNDKLQEKDVLGNEQSLRLPVPSAPGYYQTSTGTEEHALARPEFNSTLWLSKELKQARSEEFDLALEVEKKLDESSHTRQQLCETVCCVLPLL